MKLLSATTNSWIYYVIFAIIIALFIAVIILFILHKKYAAKMFNRSVWRRLYNLVQNQDWYLLNDVVINTESNALHISHLLVANKYVYVIASRYYENDLKGDSFTCQHWKVIDKNQVFLRQVSNPVAFNERRTVCLAKFLGWNATKSPMFISIVVINDSSDVIIDDTSISPQSYIIHKKDLVRLIKKIEKESDVPPLDEKSLDKLIPRLHRLSIDNKNQSNQGQNF